MTHTNSLRRETRAALVLLLLLVLTRSNIVRTHFGDVLSLPDLSWAMFWLMGAMTTHLLWPVLLMGASVAVDYWAVQHGVSADCFTPAYAALPLAYGALWGSGRRCAGCCRLRSPHDVTVVALSLLIGVTVCFAISNLGFYLASGHFADMSIAHYAAAVARYWPTYLLHTALTAFSGLLLARVWRTLSNRQTAESN